MEETSGVCDENIKYGVNDTVNEELGKVRIRHYEANIWTKSIEQIANPMKGNGAYTINPNLRRYPSLLLLYGGGIASIASKNYHNLDAIAIEAKCSSVLEPRRQTAIITNILKETIVENKQLAGRLFNRPNYFYPISNYLHDFLKVFMKDIISVDSNYDKVFDYFEYMLGLLYVDKSYNNCYASNYLILKKSNYFSLKLVIMW
ncbi:hypothetical protein OSC52_13635 [Clostridium pasteurianum]|uniref:hypothetical protein n=1 Tax=Clostridium pasteurianum TaxID=1501 RepID=UPI002260E00B|nr:hypothetical protein [Clostridium pasteurianum]UZW12891.1 hypothetical protein OSC52_13635 [Clostridium pasteurianum]